VPWFKRSVADLSPHKPGLKPWSVYVWFVPDKVSLVYCFRFISEFFGFPCQNISTIVRRTRISRGGWTIGLSVPAVQRHGLATSTWRTKYGAELALRYIEKFRSVQNLNIIFYGYNNKGLFSWIFKTQLLNFALSCYLPFSVTKIVTRRLGLYLYNSKNIHVYSRS
jgi:hypothetical protein